MLGLTVPAHVLLAAFATGLWFSVDVNRAFRSHGVPGGREHGRHDDSQCTPSQSPSSRGMALNDPAPVGSGERIPVGRTNDQRDPGSGRVGEWPARLQTGRFRSASWSLRIASLRNCSRRGWEDVQAPTGSPRPVSRLRRQCLAPRRWLQFLHERTYGVSPHCSAARNSASSGRLADKLEVPDGRQPPWPREDH